MSELHFDVIRDAEGYFGHKVFRHHVAAVFLGLFHRKILLWLVEIREDLAYDCGTEILFPFCFHFLETAISHKADRNFLVLK